jgi:hypothetical protein
VSSAYGMTRKIGHQSIFGGVVMMLFIIVSLRMDCKNQQQEERAEEREDLPAILPFYSEIVFLMT